MVLLQYVETEVNHKISYEFVMMVKWYGSLILLDDMKNKAVF